MRVYVRAVAEGRGCLGKSEVGHGRRNKTRLDNEYAYHAFLLRFQRENPLRYPFAPVAFGSGSRSH